MRVLIACERTGRVREACRALGHDAWSNDIVPADDGSEFHLQMDARIAARTGQWDAMIAHPDCTYLTNSAAWAYKPGPYHMKLKPGTLVGEARKQARDLAIAFFMELYNMPNIARVRVENPTGAMSTAFRKPDEIVHPYHFGDDASKATAFWNRGFPNLPIDPALYVQPRIVMQNGKAMKRWANQTDSGQNRLSPSDDRADLRSVTYPGIARAIAAQI